ncbi:MAG: ABC transporter permease [Thermoleophilia bacterium]|jgi:ABC-2 type transport system permease protein
MRQAWTIAVKDLLQTRRDRLAALFSVVLPVVFTLFFGLLFNDVGGSESLPLAVCDLDASPASAQLVEQLRKEPLLAVEPHAPEELESAVRNQEVAAGFIIPKGYEISLTEHKPLELPLVGLDTSSGSHSVSQAVEAAVGRLNAELLAAQTAVEQLRDLTGSRPDDEQQAAARRLSTAALATPAISTVVADSGDPNVQALGGFEQASTGSLVNWSLFSLLSVAAGLAWERRHGLLQRLKIAGVGASRIIGGKMMAMIILTLLQQLLLILLGRFAFGVGYFNSPLALFLVMLSLSVFTASLGILIATVFRSEQAVVATTVIAALLLAALGGAWFPLEITSSTFSRLAHFLPTAWVIDSLHGIVLKSWGAADVLEPLGFVWIWAVLCFGLAVWRFRPQ